RVVELLLDGDSRPRTSSKDPVRIAREAWFAVEGACRPAQPLPSKSTFNAAQTALLASGDPEMLAREFTAQADILRDLVGDSFAPAALDAAWLQWNDGVVAKLARSTYAERRIAR